MDMNQTEIDELRRLASVSLEPRHGIGCIASDCALASAARNALPRLLAALEDARAEAKRAKSELDGVMHSVDKWFDDDDPRLTDDNPATRASTAREIALQWGEKAEAERDALKAKLGGAAAITRTQAACGAKAMRCHMPFEDDDPMLPSQHPKFGDCPECGFAHRLDLGCYVELRKSQDDSANVVAWCVAGVIVLIIAALIVQAVR